jgi:hypothetical protein
LFEFCRATDEETCGIEVFRFCGSAADYEPQLPDWELKSAEAEESWSEGRAADAANQHDLAT